jgi:cholesterol oxidase
MDGIAGGAWADLADIPMTGYFIGGCVIGETTDVSLVGNAWRGFDPAERTA